MAMDRSIIDEYEHGGEHLSAAVRGLSPQDLTWRPPAGSPPEVGRWSIHEVVIHLMDSDVIAVHRMKRVIAEENPLLIGYDENKFIASLFYDEQ